MCYFIPGLNYQALEQMDRQERSRWWALLVKQKDEEKPKKR
jgi:hypothetical protein